MTQFFDISDLVRFARSNGAVSGIQRVQMRVLQHLAARCDPDKAICLYTTSRFSQVRGCRACDLFTDSTYNAGVILAKLGVENGSGAFTKRELYDDLAKYPKGSLRRAIRKAELTALGMLAPTIARARMRLPQRTMPVDSCGSPIKTWRVSRLHKTDHLVMIGTNWNVSRIEKIAKTHYRSGGTVTQVIYDLIPYCHPEYSTASLAKKFPKFLARSREYADHYICISEATKRDLQGYLAEFGGRGRIDVCPLAHEFEGYSRNGTDAVPTDPEIIEQTPTPFVLCVGTIEVRKNGIALLQAWRRLIAELGAATPLLVFAGKYGWKIDDFRQLLESDKLVQRYVRIFSHPTDADLACLYQRCLVTAYPSLAEGWGLPVGEAAWFGKYSVVSRSSSLPEVCGDLVDYVDPSDLEGLGRALARAVIANDYRRGRESAIKTAPLRSWEQVAEHFRLLIAGETGVFQEGEG
jgi:glycosyltransferase involved in cell wall biosynthesis